MVPVNVIVALVIVGLFCILMPAGLLILWHKKTKTPVVNYYRSVYHAFAK